MLLGGMWGWKKGSGSRCQWLLSLGAWLWGGAQINYWLGVLTRNNDPNWRQAGTRNKYPS